MSREPALTLQRAPDRSASRLALVLGLTAAYAVAELVGGLVANSLALLADAGHMLTDILALSLALVAAWSARRPPDAARTYGYQRLEILAALANGVALLGIGIFIVREAWQRLRVPEPIDPVLMAVVAAGGLVVNGAAMRLLRAHQHGLNARAAYLHVLGDLLGSIGALAAAAMTGGLGWPWADALVSVAIVGIIACGAVRVVRQSIHVLLEGTPTHLDIAAVRECLTRTAGVGNVHDLHLWSLGGRIPLLSAHLVLDGAVPADRVLRAATAALRDRFGIQHSTLQIEPPDFNVVERLTSIGQRSDG